MNHIESPLLFGTKLEVFIERFYCIAEECGNADTVPMIQPNRNTDEASNYDTDSEDEISDSAQIVSYACSGSCSCGFDSRWERYNIR